MEKLLTLSILPYTFLLLLLSFLAYYQNKKKPFSKRELLYSFFLGVAFSSLSLLFRQQFEAGTGIFVRHGWPVAILEGGFVDIVGLVTSLVFYLLVGLILVSMVNKERQAK